jgi:hypothetical protein
MNIKVLVLPIYLKIVPLFFTLFGIFGCIFFSEYIIVFLLDIIVFSILFYFTLVKYIFEENKIYVKYPLFYSKEYFINDIIGYTFLYSGSESKLILFINNNINFKIKFSGTKMTKYIECFINKIHDDIQYKNIEELKNNGLEFKIYRNRKILFTSDYLQLIIKNDKNKYFYKKDIQNISFQYYKGTIFTKIYLKNNKIVRFNDYMLRGMKGIFKYLEEQCKICPNVV